MIGRLSWKSGTGVSYWLAQYPESADKFLGGEIDPNGVQASHTLLHCVGSYRLLSTLCWFLCLNGAYACLHKCSAIMCAAQNDPNVMRQTLLLCGFGSYRSQTLLGRKHLGVWVMHVLVAYRIGTTDARFWADKFLRILALAFPLQGHAGHKVIFMIIITII